MPVLIDHLEDYLGPIEAVFPESQSGTKLPFLVAQFSEVFDSASAFVTIGLASAPFAQELLLLALATTSDPPNFAFALQNAAMFALSRNSALERGEVMGPYEELVHGYPFTAFYVALPVYFPAEFAATKDDDGKPVTILWLIPITTPEAEFVKQHGWNKFEDLLTEQDPDLTDFSRSPMQLS